MLNCVGALTIRHTTRSVPGIPEVFWWADRLNVAQSGIADSWSITVADTSGVVDRDFDVLVVTIN
jgi:hypothetical protein